MVVPSCTQSDLSDAARRRMIDAGETPLATADWDRALFIHFAIDPAVLQPHVPFPLDLFEGRAYVSLVAFTQTNVRPRFGGRLAALGAAPVTHHAFLNLRTYVVHEGERGIYFLAEWIPNLLDRVVGPATYGLPYRLGDLRYAYDEDGLPFAGTVVARGGCVRFDVATDPDAEPAPAPPGLERFLLEHYTAFTGGAGGAVARRFRIWHEPWPQVPARVTLKDAGLLNRAAPWFGACRYVGANFSPGVHGVWIGPPRVVFGRAAFVDWVVPALLLGTTSALALLASLPAWALMWTIAFALFFACKWVTLRRAGAVHDPDKPRAQRSGAPDAFALRSEESGSALRSLHSLRSEPGLSAKVLRSLAYLFAWVGMDAPTFLDRTRRPACPTARDWTEATLKTFAGAALVWGVARLVALAHPFAAAWVGMVGLALLLHFGTFHLLALAWRRAGVDATALMDRPALSRSLSEFWSARWNRGFHQVATSLVFRPAVRRWRLRPAAALLGTFLASGLVHDWVISLPARAGWGLPTLYFLVQGAAVLLERSAPGRRLGLALGLRGRLFALAVVVAPLPLLFHAPFVSRVMVPFLDAIGAW